VSSARSAIDQDPYSESVAGACQAGVAAYNDRALRLRTDAMKGLLPILLFAWAGALHGAGEPGVDAYEKGDHARAAREFERAAQGGNRLAQYNYAMLLLRGEGVAGNGAEGVRWLRKAADAGLAQAQYSLGLLYENGAVVAKSQTAQVSLATQYFLGRGAKQDYAQAAHWYELAAEAGDVGAQYIIASMYEHGDGVRADLRRALGWYQRAARQGDVGAAAQAQDVARRIGESGH